MVFLAFFAISVKLYFVGNHGKIVHFRIGVIIGSMEMASGHVQGTMLQRNAAMAIEANGVMNVTRVAKLINDGALAHPGCLFQQMILLEGRQNTVNRGDGIVFLLPRLHSGIDLRGA